jgi:chromosome segregation ATPase
VSDTFKPDYQAHPDGGVLRELARLTERNAALKAEVERLEAKLRAEERRADRLYTDRYNLLEAADGDSKVAQEQLAAERETRRMDVSALDTQLNALQEQLAAAQSRATDLAASLEAQTRKNVLLRAVADCANIGWLGPDLYDAIVAAKDGGAL